MADERTIEAGLEQNAEMVKEFYTHMVFDAGDYSDGIIVPANEVARKAVSAVRDGTNIEWTASIGIGDFEENTDIKSIWMVGTSGGSDVFLVVHKISATTVGPSAGLTYTFPYSISGYTAGE